MSEARVACAPPTEIDTNLAISVDGDVPENVTEVTRIEGNLTISGTIATFPDFAALTVVEGDLTIDNITTRVLHPDRHLSRFG